MTPQPPVLPDDALLRDGPAGLGSRGSWLIFREPRLRLSTQRVDEVRVRLAEAERLVEKDGLWAVGWVAYEAAPAFDPALVTHEPGDLPLLQLSLYPEPERLDRLPAPKPPEEGMPGYRVGEWRPSVSREGFGRAFDTIQEALAAGDSYQVNYSLRLRTPLTGDPYAFFVDLARGQRAGHAAFLGDGPVGGPGDGPSDGRWTVACASPELFFRRDGDRVTCRPMKGTAPRGRTTAEDDARAAALAVSAKDRAENLMIVDMIRNDLGRIARPGTVHPETLFTVERYPTVLQMTSTVSAQTDASTEELFAALFPCASITGAPKIRTTELLRGLEPEPRGVYTGAIGYLAPGRRACWGVAIRTAVVDGHIGQAEYGVGGGIVADSTVDAEWEETRVKARVLRPLASDFELLETLRLEPVGTKKPPDTGELAGYRLLSEHLARLADSARYFDYAVDPVAVRRELATLAAGLPPEPHRVRLLVDRSGRVHREATPLPPEEPFVELVVDCVPASGHPPPPIVRLAVAAGPVDTSDPFLFHKTTHRRVYEEALHQARQQWESEEREIDDVLLWNERGELTETTLYNLLLRLDGVWVTPPVACGLLAGTYRARLLAEGRVRERTVTVEDLERAEAVALINSVRGVRQAELVTSPARPRVETRQKTRTDLPLDSPRSPGAPATPARPVGSPAPKARS